MIEMKEIEHIVEAALLTAGRVLTLPELLKLFKENECPTSNTLKQSLENIAQHWQGRGIELVSISGGYRCQTKACYAPWVARLWDEKPPKYSRAFLETLALIAYKQPVTRADIEDVRGVAVSSQIIRTLIDHGWVRVIGHKEVPGRPALLATTKGFLEHFNLSRLDELPPLADIIELDEQAAALEEPSLPEGQEVFSEARCEPEEMSEPNE